MDMAYFVAVASLLSLTFVFFAVRGIKVHTEGTDEMRNIKRAMISNLNIYIRRQYKGVLLFFVCMFVFFGGLSALGYLNKFAPFAFLTGGVFTALSGIIGVKTATTASCAVGDILRGGSDRGLKIAFSAGTAIGFIVVSLALFDISVWYFFLKFWYTAVEGARNEILVTQKIISNMLTFGVGASCMALFGRVSGEIFSKSTDMGLNLDRKAERHIEKDSLSASVGAYIVGDSLGSAAGMGMDLYVSFIGSMISTSVLALAAGLGINGVEISMLLSAAGVMASIIGVLFVKANAKLNGKNFFRFLRIGKYISAGIVVILSFFVVNFLLPQNMCIFYAVLSGVVSGIIIDFVSEYYTSGAYKPAREFADSLKTGSVAAIIEGASSSMLSALWPVLIIGAAVIASFFVCGGAIFDPASFSRGMHGVAIASLGMLSTLGIELTSYMSGSIADNANEIVRVARMDEDAREKADLLTSLGGTESAIGQVFSVSSAVFTSIALIAAYISQMNSVAPMMRFNLGIANPVVLVGLFIGAVFPFLFVSLTMRSAAGGVRKVLRTTGNRSGGGENIAGEMVEPDYETYIDRYAQYSQNLTIYLMVLAVIVPVLVGLIFGINGVVGFLVGVVACGFVFALVMSNISRVCISAKRYNRAHSREKDCEFCESFADGNVVENLVKDTSVTSISILMKLSVTVSIIFMGLIAVMHLI